MGFAYHAAPLHYLPLICASGALYSKAQQRARFARPATHFRSSSRDKDIDYGFGDFVHLFSADASPLLRSKLRQGIPHVELMIPIREILHSLIHFCRYNIAYTEMPETIEDTPSAKRYAGRALPTACKLAEVCHFLQETKASEHFEILVPHIVRLPASTMIQVYSQRDADVMKKLIEHMGSVWSVQRKEADMPYPERDHAEIFYSAAWKHAADPDGDILTPEFDYI
ncbi:MAG: hypothetical protein GVY13_08245 [Alphaproteobacteria bacterium]|nr:hypothetical protein [Alphaproteobacteria bacterium]